MTIRIVLVDDQALVRAGFHMILGAEDDIDVVAEASDGDEGVAAVRQERPDVVLMDIQMPRMDGLEATRRIMAESTSATRVVMLTTFERDDYLFEALRVGASGFLLKNAPPEELVHEGYVRRPVPHVLATELARLTDREREVLQLLAAGRSNAELAADMYVGEGTIKTHVSNVLSKLALRDRVQAVVFAYESGLVEPGRT